MHSLSWCQAMKGMSRTMNLPQIQRIMMEFEKEMDSMDMKEEMMSDAVDNVMEVRFMPLIIPARHGTAKPC